MNGTVSMTCICDIPIYAASNKLAAERNQRVSLRQLAASAVVARPPEHSVGRNNLAAQVALERRSL